MTTNDELQLGKMRVNAKISQTEMAMHLGVTQSQISRYELDPDNVPFGIVKKWKEFCGYIAGTKGLDIADPRIELKERIKLIENYAAVYTQQGSKSSSIAPVTIKQFLASIHTAAKKPRIGVFGKFDAGKSRLINVLIGGDPLPTGYQPATSIVCLLRHTSQKPSWQAEDVWIMSKEFELDLADDQEHCTKHKMFAGGYESLKHFGTHTGKGREHDAFAAVIYVDSPLLMGAEIIDIPGYGHSDDDKDRIEMAHKMVDILIYTAQTIGFLDQQDLVYLSALLRNLPTIEDKNNKICNLFIVATQAHHVRNADERYSILNTASARSYRYLDNWWQQTGTEILENDFRKRFFTFSADDVSLRSDFEQDIRDLISNIIPTLTLSRLDNHIQQAKEEAFSINSTWIAGLETVLVDGEKAQNEIKAIEKNEENRLIKKSADEKRINDLINHFANESKVFISRVFTERASVSAIEALIESRYHDNQKEAQQLAAPYLIESLQNGINDWIKVKSNELGDEIDNFLDGYRLSIDKDALKNSGWNFNPRVAFISALSSLGTIGALAGWASIVAAGSNLGSYILIGKIVGWLSSIGISLGGAGTVMSAVSAIGGPITLGIAAALLVGFGTYSLFGDSWQTKLAKKIHKELIENKVEEKFLTGVTKFWNDTKDSFKEAARITERDYLDELDRLRTLAFSSEKETIEQELKLAKEIFNFFIGLPWKTINI